MSHTFLRIRFLNALRDASPPDRRRMVENITQSQMSAVTEVIYHIVKRLIPILVIDMSTFRERQLALRQLASSRTSFAVKRRVLISHNSVLQRILRVFYLIRVMRYKARAHEE